MSLSYSCFISYRHDSLQIAKDFQDALERELSLLIDLPVFRDEERLLGGDFYNSKLSQALCSSACMIMIYVPIYFDERHTYCAREFRAMEILEQDRLQMLKLNGLTHDCGLIIPIVYRGRDILPLYVSKSRQLYDFENHFLGGRTQKSKQYLVSIKTIANYIFQRCADLRALPLDPCNCCDSFDIPSEGSISGWLDGLLPPRPRFPGR